MQDEKLDIENEKEPDVNKRKTEISIFVLPTHVFLNLYPQGHQRTKKDF